MQTCQGKLFVTVKRWPLLCSFSLYFMFHIVGKFGRGKVWQIDSFQVFGERNFGELIDQPKGN